MKANDIPVELFESEIQKPPSKIKKKVRWKDREFCEPHVSSDSEDSLVIVISHGDVNPVKEGRKGSELSMHSMNNEFVNLEECGNLSVEEVESVDDGSVERNDDEMDKIPDLSSEEEEFFGFEGEVEEELSTNESSDTDVEESDQCRRSSRNRFKKKIFTYENIGGNPVIK